LSDPQEGRLVWPPTKEDLEMLYLEERLSAARIATVYGLKYKNPKVAESTILYQLKKNGIRRRDSAEHNRKVTKNMIDQWVERYQSGESLKQIAGTAVDPVTVWNHLSRRGLKLRDKVEAQIQAVTKYERRQFQGDLVEKAYLMGLRYGDLHVVRHGRAIRVRVSTTHPAMAELFENLFSAYGHVSWYPRKAKLVGYEWTLECDLDSSFQFLLSKPTVDVLESFSRPEMVAFLAGVFDAEGSIMLHDKRGRHNPEASFSGTEDSLLEYIKKAIGIMGFHCKLRWFIQKADRQGITGYSREGQVTLWRFRDVKALLQILPIKHWEKVEKARLVQGMEYRSEFSKNLETRKAWEVLIARIKTDKVAFVDLARKSIESSDNTTTNAVN
jgi:hypothetical protein